MGYKRKRGSLALGEKTKEKNGRGKERREERKEEEERRGKKVLLLCAIAVRLVPLPSPNRRRAAAAADIKPTAAPGAVSSPLSDFQVLLFFLSFCFFFSFHLY